MTNIHCNVHNDKISVDEWKLIEDKMLPGRYSESGFLGPDENLSSVINKDSETLKELGITHDQVADRLENIYEQYKTLLSLIETDKSNGGVNQLYTNRKIGNNEYKIESNLLLSTTCYMGAQGCPFQNKNLDCHYHGYKYGSCDVTVKNIDTKESFTYSTLLPHMIKSHQFFEGSVPYRVDPRVVARVLDIKPGVDYSPKYINKDYWSLDSSGALWNSEIFFKTRMERVKSFKAMQHYSCDHKNIIIRTRYKAFNIHAFLSPDHFMEMRIDSYRKAYVNNMKYVELRELIHLNDNEKKSRSKSKSVNFQDNFSSSMPKIHSDEEIKKMCDDDEKIYNDYKQKKNIDSMVVHLFVTELKLKPSPLKISSWFSIDWLPGSSWFKPESSTDQPTNTRDHSLKFELFGIEITEDLLDFHSCFKKSTYPYVEIS